MATIEFRNVSKTYGGGAVALSDFSLSVADGEFCVFVGPSGCGKSTALKLLAGLEATSGGEIHIGGENVTDHGPGKRDIAMVFQNYALYPHMSVRSNIGFGLKMHGVPRAEVARKVEEAAALLELTDYLDRKPRALSGGQRQRVALGRAIVREPKAFLMDEPLSNLDAKLRVQTRSQIVMLQRRLGVTAIYVTHDQTEALTMADRIVVMRKGLIQQVGSPDELFHHPANMFVAGFIGSPGMNFFRAPIERDGEQVFLTFCGARMSLNPAADLSGLGDEAVFGIRPEHVVIGEAAGGPALTVDLVESLGTEKVLHLALPDAYRMSLAGTDLGGEKGDVQREGLLVRVIDDRSFRAGESLPVRFPADKIHVFDPRSHQTVG
ncbi:ABC transporter ATP-binding protein [Frigidibacter sp. ROC022]|uniref:ABC transporter ATP-binding protein n=1 Tax=Frigidibacter sp. ROC022 TaxID=2971796 RepID=UPI00215A4222|nr:sn-glycerol-3-phosphate ABC transporter ATP-binding protein UgpC [Frigidibacter sp. ROC022]